MACPRSVGRVCLRLRRDQFDGIGSFGVATAFRRLTRDRQLAWQYLPLLWGAKCALEKVSERLNHLTDPIAGLAAPNAAQVVDSPEMSLLPLRRSVVDVNRRSTCNDEDVVKIKGHGTRTNADLQENIHDVGKALSLLQPCPRVTTTAWQPPKAHH